MGRLGDMTRAHQHLAEAQRLEASATGDAVDRVPETSATGSRNGASTTSSAPKQPTDIWAVAAGDPVRLKCYRYEDEGPTVLLTLDLNDHLGIGEEASTLVDSIKQFRVK